jgi:hypothetical protein
MEIVEVSGDYDPLVGECVVPKSGLTSYSVNLPFGAKNGEMVAVIPDSQPGSVVKTQTQGGDIMGNGNNGPTQDNVYSARYSAIFISNGNGTWWVLT